MNKRSIEIYRLWKEEGYKKTELAKRYGVSRARIGDICNSIEHGKKTFSDFISELPLRMRVHVLRNRFGDENKATPETVAKLDPLELDKVPNIGTRTLKQTKDIFLKYDVQHLMHENWRRY